MLEHLCVWNTRFSPQTDQPQPPEFLAFEKIKAVLAGMSMDGT